MDEANARFPTMKVGVCIKAQDGTVMSQNQFCIKICGKHSNEKCDKGCVRKYRRLIFENQDLDVGFRLIRNIETNGHLVDIAVVNDGDQTMTLLFDRSENIKSQLAFLERFNLSKSEMKIMGKFLLGMSAREISEQLFISKATLRSHLNNIYKKIPEDLKKKIISAHLGRSE